MNQLLVIEGALVLALMLGGFQGTGCTGQKLRVAGTVLAEYGDSAGNRTIVLDSVHLMAAVAVAVYDFQTNVKIKTTAGEISVRGGDDEDGI